MEGGLKSGCSEVLNLADVTVMKRHCSPTWRADEENKDSFPPVLTSFVPAERLFKARRY